MKKLAIAIVTIIITISSCSKSPEQRAKELIRQRMEATLPNIESYDPIAFGPLIQADLIPYMLPEYNTMFEKMKSISSEMKQETELMKLCYRESEALVHHKKFEALKDDLYQLNDSLENFVQNFTFDSTMVSMTHRFRYYDEKLKRHEIVNMTVYFDKDVAWIKGTSFPTEEDPRLEIYYGTLE